MNRFDPQPGQSIRIGGAEYRVSEHPAAPGVAFGQSGRRATVYQLASATGNVALKHFLAAFRTERTRDVSGALASYAEIPGLEVCRREVIAPETHGDLLAQEPELAWSVVMPWVSGETWHDIVRFRRGLTAEQSHRLAASLATVLGSMEGAGIAHCDLSGPNTIIDLEGLRVSLVDVEDLYAPDLPVPAHLPAGSYGYAHRTAPQGIWGPEGDRFAGGILLAEVLGWSDPAVRRLAVGEQYFDASDIQQPTERYEVLRNSIAAHHGRAAAELFEASWFSDALSDCPSLSSWQSALGVTGDVSAETPTRPAADVDPGTSALIAEAERLLVEGRADDACAIAARAYRDDAGASADIFTRALMARAASSELAGDLGAAHRDYSQAASVVPAGGLANELAGILREFATKPLPIQPPKPVSSSSPPSSATPAAPQQAVRSAEASGGKGGPPPPAPPDHDDLKLPSRWRPLGAFVGLIALMAVLLAAGYFWNQSQEEKKTNATNTAIALAATNVASDANAEKMLQSLEDERASHDLAEASNPVTNGEVKLPGEPVALGVNVLDLIASASFQNPNVSDGSSWDYGFTFRIQGDETWWALHVTSDGNVVLVDADNRFDRYQASRAEAISVDANAMNELEIMVINRQIYVFVNDLYVETWRLQAPASPGTPAAPPLAPAAGDVAVSIGVLPSSRDMPSIEFKSWNVWNLDVSADDLKATGTSVAGEQTGTAEAAAADASATQFAATETASAVAAQGTSTAETATAVASATQFAATETAAAGTAQASSTAEAAAANASATHFAGSQTAAAGTAQASSMAETAVAIASATNAAATAQAQDRRGTLESNKDLSFELTTSDGATGNLFPSVDERTVTLSILPVRDFIASATFINPTFPNVTYWDFGFLFRNGDQLVVQHSGEWLYSPRVGNAVSGETTLIKPGPGDRNTIEIQVDNDALWIFINGAFVEEISLAGSSQPAQVQIGAWFDMDQTSAGGDALVSWVDFERFRIWDLGVTNEGATHTAIASITPTWTPTVTPSPTLTPSPTPTVTQTVTPLPSPTATPSPTPAPTYTQPALPPSPTPTTAAQDPGQYEPPTREPEYGWALGEWRGSFLRTDGRSFEFTLSFWGGSVGQLVGSIQYIDCSGNLIFMPDQPDFGVFLAEELGGGGCGESGVFWLYPSATSEIGWAWAYSADPTIPIHEGYLQRTTASSPPTATPSGAIQWLLTDGSQEVQFDSVWPDFDVADKYMTETSGGFVAMGEWGAESVQSGDHFLFGFGFGGTYDPEANYVGFDYLAIASTDGRWWIMTFEAGDWVPIVNGTDPGAMTLIGEGQGQAAELQVDDGWAQFWVNGYWLGEAYIGFDPAGVVAPVLGREDWSVGAPVYSVLIYNYSIGLFP
ncbi:MAG: hypothetical protein IT335_07195 [Thermomicrobiales bacterium]|nr:hypothetical protein [Thermomicrobiales bacterium]